ncbi:MAG: uracil-DNA glycosylase [Chloroflexi bacterium]|nr:uracil-DNA glycosylase [Chloroflexota bacterium]
MTSDIITPDGLNPTGSTETADWTELNRQITTCRLCPRLVEWRESVAVTKRRAYHDCDYWGRPVPGFGDRRARLLVVGLAPGAHGSNRTGRMFTGDASGEFLYAALHRTGFANQPISTDMHDGLALQGVFITAVARCAPPDNRPLPGEIRNCRPFLLKEMALMPHIQGIVALGQIAFNQIATIFNDSIPKSVKFSHGALVELKDGLPWLLASYHPSRQNTQTGRLTQDMFDQIWSTARNYLQ